MRVELGFDNSLCPVEIERFELRITSFTDADYRNVPRHDSEIAFWHEHDFPDQSSEAIPSGYQRPPLLRRSRPFRPPSVRSGLRRASLTSSLWLWS